DHAILGIERSYFGLDADCFVDRADLEPDVAAQRLAGFKHNVGFAIRVEPALFRRKFVLARRQIGDCVDAICVRDDGPRLVSLDVADRDRYAWHNALCGIGSDACYGGEIRLSKKTNGRSKGDAAEA